jgi:3'(2'), 5'-bisphosphate nucleotidase
MLTAGATSAVESLDDDQVAELAASEAARALVEMRAFEAGVDGKELGRLGDGRSHALIVETIQRHFPDDWILSEESADSTERLSRHRVWIVDPLDGTREYGEDGRTDWAVHVALVIGGRLALGVVALPALGLVLTSARPPKLREHQGRIRVSVSRSRAPEIAGDVTRRLGGVVTPMGSAGFKAMSILLGWSDVYLHAGGQYEWDSAAPVAVAQAAGLHASRIDGSALAYNRHPAWLPDLLICRPEVAEKTLQAIKDAGGS